MRGLSPEAEALNAEIASAASWRALQRTLESAGGGVGGDALDPFQLVAMLTRAAALPAPTAAEPDDLADFQGFVAAVYGWLLAKMDAARPPQLGRALAAVARLGLYNAELVGAVVARAEREMHNTADGDVVALLEGLAGLGHAAPPALGEQVLRRTQLRLATMAPRDLARLVAAMPTVGIAPAADSGWVAACADAAVAGVRELRAGDFRAVVVGLASLGWRPSTDAQLRALTDRCFPLLTYELRVERDGGSGGGGRASAAPSAAASVDEEAGPQPKQQQQQQQWRRGPKSVAPQVAIDWLVNVAWAFAQMTAGTGAAMPPQWAAALFDKLQYVRRFMRPAELASLVSSCAYAGARPSDAALASVLRDLQNMYSDASGDDLAGVAMALAQFQYRPA